MNGPGDMINIATPNLHVVVMPLIRLLRDGDLSWSDKEEICAALAAILKTHAAMKAEARHLFGHLTGAASGAGAVT